MTKKKERVMIFIDNGNILHEFLKIKTKFDYGKLKNILTNKRDVTGTFVYMGIIPPVTPDKLAFLSILKRYGITAKVRYLKFIPNKNVIKEKIIDVELATDMVAFAYENLYDTAILVSGDRDFLPVIKKLKKINKKIELWSFKSSLSTQLAQEVGKNINYIDNIIGKIKFGKK